MLGNCGRIGFSDQTPAIGWITGGTAIDGSRRQGGRERCCLYKACLLEESRHQRVEIDILLNILQYSSYKKTADSGSLKVLPHADTTQETKCVELFELRDGKDLTVALTDMEPAQVPGGVVEFQILQEIEDGWSIVRASGAHDYSFFRWTGRFYGACRIHIGLVFVHIAMIEPR